MSLVVGQLATSPASYLQLSEAARILLGQWWERASFVSVDHGRLEPCETPEAGLPCWATASPEAVQLLVASVLMGHRYQGWQAALRQARKGVERR